MLQARMPMVGAAQNKDRRGDADILPTPQPRGSKESYMRYLMLAAILLAGCVTTSEVVPMANGQYLLTGRASGGMNAGKGTAAAARKAADYCATLGKAPTIVSTDFHGAASVGGESTAFVFTCN